MAALGLKPRGQIPQPLRGGVNEQGLQAGRHNLRDCIKFQSLLRNAVNRELTRGDCGNCSRFCSAVRRRRLL